MYAITSNGYVCTSRAARFRAKPKATKEPATTEAGPHHAIVRAVPPRIRMLAESTLTSRVGRAAMHAWSVNQTKEEAHACWTGHNDTYTIYTILYSATRFLLYTALRTRLPGCTPSASLTSCIGGFCPSSTLEDRSGVASCASERAIRFAKNGERRKRCTCGLVSFLWLSHARDQPPSRL